MKRPTHTARSNPPAAPAVRCALERDFPFEQVSEVARVESFRKEIHRPIYHVHKWWATRLGSVFRAILLGVNLQPHENIFDEFYRAHNFTGRIVLDPFMGSGTTIGEALKLGCQAVGMDINPLPCLQVETVLDGCGEDELRAAYARLERHVAERIRSLYRSSYGGEPADVLYTFWVKVVDCPDCGHQTRLFNRWLFAAHAYPRRHPEAHALCPRCEAVVSVNYGARRCRCPDCGRQFDPQSGPARHSTFVCEGCGNERLIVDAVRQRTAPPEHKMYALLLLLPDGNRVFKRPDPSDLALYASASLALRRRRLPIPRDPIPPGHNTDQARRHNYRYWRQLFNDRQLLALGELLKGILREPSPKARQALLLLFSGVLEFNNMFCTFKGEGTGAVRHLFAHHILRPPRTPLEAHPWGCRKSSGSFSALLGRRLLAAHRYREAPFELTVATDSPQLASRKVFDICAPLRPRLTRSFAELAQAKAEALVVTADAQRMPIPDASVDFVVTDPPYFDNVHYSELADFFYCWLRGPLSRTRPDFSRSTSRHPGEVQGISPSEFTARLGRVFKECSRVLKPGGTITFTFHHSRHEGWVGLVRALQDAGLQVTAAHPVVGELAEAAPKRQAREPILLDLVVVCRPVAGAAAGTRRAFDLKLAQRAARKTVARLHRCGRRLSRGDVRVVLMGQLLLQAHETRSITGSRALARSIEEAIGKLSDGQLPPT